MRSLTSRITGRPVGRRFAQGLRIMLYQGSPGDSFDRGIAPTCMRTLRLKVAHTECKICGCAWEAWELQGSYQRQRVVAVSGQGMCNQCGVGNSPFVVSWIAIPADRYIDQARLYSKRYPSQRGSYRLLCSTLESGTAVRLVRDYITRAREFASSIRRRNSPYHGTLCSSGVDEDELSHADAGRQTDQAAEPLVVEQGAEHGQVDSSPAIDEIHQYLCLSDDNE